MDMLKQAVNSLINEEGEAIWQELLSKKDSLTFEDIKNLKINDFVQKSIDSIRWSPKWNAEVVKMVNYALDQLSINAKDKGVITWQQIIEYLKIDIIIAKIGHDEKDADNLNQMIKKCMELANDKISNTDFIRILKIDTLVKHANYVVLLKILELFPSAVIRELTRELQLNNDQLIQLISLSKHEPDLQDCTDNMKVVMDEEESRLLSDAKLSILVTGKIIERLAYLGKFEALLQMLERFPKPLANETIQELNLSEIIRIIASGRYECGNRDIEDCKNCLNSIIKKCLPDNTKLNIERVRILGINDLFRGGAPLYIMKHLIDAWCIQPPAVALTADFVKELHLAEKLQAMVFDGNFDEKIITLCAPQPVDAVILEILEKKPASLDAVNECLQKARESIIEAFDQLKIEDIGFYPDFKDEPEEALEYIAKNYLLETSILTQLGPILTPKIIKIFAEMAEKNYDEKNSREILKKMLDEVMVNALHGHKIKALIDANCEDLSYDDARDRNEQISILLRILLAKDPVDCLIKIIKNTDDNRQANIMAAFKLLRHDMAVLTAIAHSLGKNNIAEKIADITTKQKQLLVKLLDSLTATNEEQNLRFKMAQGLIAAKKQTEQNIGILQPKIARDLQRIIDAKHQIEQALETDKHEKDTGSERSFQ